MKSCKSVLDELMENQMKFNPANLPKPDYADTLGPLAEGLMESFRKSRQLKWEIWHEEGILRAWYEAWVWTPEQIEQLKRLNLRASEGVSQNLEARGRIGTFTCNRIEPALRLSAKPTPPN